MLNSDIALAFNASISGVNNIGIIGQTCGGKDITSYVCQNPVTQVIPSPSTADLVKSYISDNKLFLSAFAVSFVKMTSVGYKLDGAGGGKLGSLTSVNLDTC